MKNKRLNSVPSLAGKIFRAKEGLAGEAGPMIFAGGVKFIF